jgi:hypothetical protein
VRTYLLDGGEAFGCGRNLDHQIGPVDALPEPSGLLGRGVGVLRQMGRDLETDKTVPSLGLPVGRCQLVGRHPDVGNGDRFVSHHRGGVRRLGQQGPEITVVLRTVTDRLLENGRIAGYTADPVLGNHPLQPAIDEDVAADKVEPDGLAPVHQLLYSIHLLLPGCSRPMLTRTLGTRGV